MKGLKKYYVKKLLWYLATLVIAVVLNFMLPRFMPGNPVSAIASKAVAGMTDQTAIEQVYNDYVEKFGLNESLPTQFGKYLKNLAHGNMGISFSQYPRQVSDIIKSSMWWTICLQFPAILLGWFLGNILGAIAAYKKGLYDKGVLPFFLFLGNIPAFGMAILLLFTFAVRFKIFPTGGGYGFDLMPSASLKFIWSVIRHYQLPFFSIVLITIGGQAIGMRSMSIYELNADYVKYSRYLGIKDKKIVKYVFKNAMLPQITGLAMSIGTMMGGALVSEIIFNYPGLGTTLLTAIKGQDFPLISASTLIITIMVLLANLVVEILYAVIDPRIKAAQQE